VIDRLIVSTDNEAIAAVATKYGADVPFVRPPALATDTATSVDVVAHALANIGDTFEFVVLLQPTSPLRSASDIDAAFHVMTQAGGSSCVSVSAVPTSPYWMYVLDGEGRLIRLLGESPLPVRRQDLPPVYQLNGAIYIALVEEFLRRRAFVGEGTVGFVMPPERSVDIDDAEDLELARQIIRRSSTAATSSRESTG
jgi:N-acylneuraminate cytidylyltransferase